jgi:glycolate oxidase iron-sulfur subunit
VRYGELITPFRSWSEKQRSSWLRTRFRRLRLTVMSRPELMRPLTRLGMLARPFARFLPQMLSAPLALLPKRLAPRDPLSSRVAAQGQPRARVALLAGCAQQVLQPGIHSATVELLRRNGVEVLVPEDQGCCGALALHGGDMEFARPLARRNLRAFGFLSQPGEQAGLQEVDAVLTNAAGCGSGLHDYPLLFKGEPEEQAARQFAARVKDVTRFLAELGLVGDYRLPEPTRIAYQDACHLAHAQKERLAPRQLLARIENLEMVEPAEWEVCCGSAGLYNLDQPEIARQLGQRKVRNLLATGAQRFVTGNIGCSMQLQSHLAIAGSSCEVQHTVELLLQASVPESSGTETGS